MKIFCHVTSEVLVVFFKSPFSISFSSNHFPQKTISLNQTLSGSYSTATPLDFMFSFPVSINLLSCSFLILSQLVEKPVLK